MNAIQFVKAPAAFFGLGVAASMVINKVDDSPASDTSILSRDGAIALSAGTGLTALFGYGFPTALEGTRAMGAAHGAAMGAGWGGGFVTGELLSRALGW